MISAQGWSIDEVKDGIRRFGALYISIPDPAGKPKYMWKKEWVRPHESLWSVMRNFRIVNGQCSYKEALNLLDIGPLTSRKQDFQPDSEYVIYSRYTSDSKIEDVFFGRDENGKLTVKFPKLPSGGLNIFFPIS